MRILVITWAWPPVGRIGALRPMGMAREWVKAGHEVHVLTGPGRGGGEPSPDLLTRATETGAIVHRADAPAEGTGSGASGGAAAGAGGTPSRLRQVLSQWKRFPDRQRSWIGPARAFARRLHAERNFDVVWSTSPPESCHFVGESLARGGVPWVADFRDPWADYFIARWDPISRGLIGGISRWVLRPAGVLTAASEGIAASIGRGCGRPVRCVRNGYDRAAPGVGAAWTRQLGYFGRIDARAQRPDRLWPALRLLQQRGRPCGVLFHLSAGGGGGASCLAIPDDLAGLVSVRGPVDHDEALARMSSLLGLVVLCLEERSGAGIVPGKLYEYAGSGRPSVVIAPPDYEARRLVEQRGVGMGAWSPEEIADAIERLDRFSIDAVGRQALSREATAAEMLSWLERARPRAWLRGL